MKKIMFNDKFGLTKAVLEGRKTMTRRIIKTPRTMEGKDVYGFSVVKYPRTGVPIEVMALDADGAQINNILPKYKVGEVVAVAQSYKDAGFSPDTLIREYKTMKDVPGWTNKMFVEAQSMLYFIRITNVRVERLQDISDEDCLREGIIENTVPCQFGGIINNYTYEGAPGVYVYAWDAFSALINRIFGKGTWDSNPWVFVYEFELVK